MGDQQGFLTGLCPMGGGEAHGVSFESTVFHGLESYIFLLHLL